ncbi:hypothetical protein RI367_005879 [Sorochytrium milnesiophthora]
MSLLRLFPGKRDESAGLGNKLWQAARTPSSLSFSAQRTVQAGDVQISVMYYSSFPSPSSTSNPTSETLHKSLPQIHRDEADNLQTAAVPSAKTVGDRQFIAAPALIPDRPVQVIDQAHEKAITALGISNSGLTIATGGEDCMVRLWDFYTGKQQKTLGPFKSAVYATEFSEDDRQLVAGESNGTLSTWVLARSKQKRQYKGHTMRINVARYLRHGGSGDLISGGSDNSIRLWQHKFFGLSSKKLEAQSPVMDIVVVEDGSRCISAQFSGHVYVWDLTTLTRIASIEHFEGQAVTSLSLHMSDKVIVTLSRDNIIRFISIDTGTVTQQLSHPDFKAASNYAKLAMSHDKSTLVAGASDGSVFAWNLSTFLILGIVKAHKYTTLFHFHPRSSALTASVSSGAVNCAMWNFGGNLLTAGVDRKIVIWDGRELVTSHLKI